MNTDPNQQNSNQSTTSSSSKPKFQDIILHDKDTGEPFVFTAKEQEFFAKQGFTNVPTRSPERRKELREQKYKGKPITNIQCAGCGRVGKVTQSVPNKQKVYCQNCFAKMWNPYLEAHPEEQGIFKPIEQYIQPVHNEE